MLKSIRLINFKSFEDETIPLGSMTVLMGENGAGKSSIIQSLLLLRQSANDGVLQHQELSLNGDLCSVGVGRDLLRQGSDDETIGIELADSVDGTHTFTFGYDPDADRLPLQTATKLPTNLESNGFAYLTAERIGPRLTSPRSIAQALAGQLGIHGEGALAVLEQFRAEILPPDDPRRKGRSGSLEELFQLYLAEICSSVRIDLHPYRDVDSIGSTFSFSAPGGLPGIPFRPTNVGFGLSYGLPIIVGCLVAKAGSILIVENPEAHLHTKSQRAICELLANTAKAGVQVIIETHSREVFHWLRNNAKAGSIATDIACINYVQAVDTPNGQRASTVTTLFPLDAELTDWPQSFYDAYGSPLDLVAPAPAR